MKRDWDVVREVLEAVESGDVAGYIRSEEFRTRFPTNPPADFLGHVEILIDAGIIKNACVKRNPDGEFEFWDFRGAFVTMQGHDLLDAMRNKELWQRVKSKSLHTGISLSWEFIKAAIPVVITEALTQ